MRYCREFEDPAVTCLARGASYLAAIWTSAWSSGDGAATILERWKRLR
jgi:hypothetical protein